MWQRLILAFVIGVFVFTMLLTIPVWALYNWKVVPLFHTPRLDMDDVFWLLLLARIVIPGAATATAKES